MNNESGEKGIIVSFREGEILRIIPDDSVLQYREARKRRCGCGTVLSKYNYDSKCWVCQKRLRDYEYEMRAKDYLKK